MDGGLARGGRLRGGPGGAYHLSLLASLPSRRRRVMGITVRPLHPHFAAEIVGGRLRDIDEPTFGAVREAFEEYSVLVFHDQHLPDDEQIAFTRRFGPLEETVRSIAHNTRVALQIADLSNVDPEGNTMAADDRRMLYHKGNQLWHSDSSFKRVPAMASLLSAREVPPEGGETEYASLRAEWDTKRDRRVMHRTTVAGEGPTVPDPDVADAAAAR